MRFAVSVFERRQANKKYVRDADGFGNEIMKYNIDDLLPNVDGAVGGASNEEVHILCVLGDDCTHANSDECDRYRQELLEAEHKKTCTLGEKCNHFASAPGHERRGMPDYTIPRGESPAQYLLRTRGVKS